jgi:hypothetical protein
MGIFDQKKYTIFFKTGNIFTFFSSNHWIRLGIQPQMLDPDPDQMNTDPKHWLSDVFCYQSPYPAPS